ncbi:MAG: WbqC family protein [Phycisphaerae bacterium]|nr:WbqC family protein [Phycisphaerae bacterium]
MRIAISQPRYLPALNYLQRVVIADRFVLLDDVQHQRRAFEHRNRVRDSSKAHWLAIPIDRSATSRPMIAEMRAADSNWVDEHIKRLRAYYGTAAHFDNGVLDYLYDGMASQRCFVDIAEEQLLRVLTLLGFPGAGKLLRSSELGLGQSGSQLLAALTRAVGGDVYISGPNGRNYIDMKHFAGIEVVYHDYDFPHYHQQGDGFIPWLGWLDCLFNEGIDKVREFVAGNVSLSMGGGLTRINQYCDRKGAAGVGQVENLPQQAVGVPCVKHSCPPPLKRWATPQSEPLPYGRGTDRIPVVSNTEVKR